MGRRAVTVLIILATFVPVWLLDWTSAGSSRADLDPIFTPPLATSLDTAAFSPGEPTATGGEEPTEVAQRVTVKSGDTLAQILSKARVPAREAHAAITALTEVYDARSIRPGQEVEIAFASASAEDSSFARFTLHPSVSQEIVVRRDDDGGFTVENNEKALERRMFGASGTIDDSLYMSAVRLGVSPAVLMEMIRILSWDVDFQRDIQPGDRFEVMYERFYTDDDSFVRHGDVLYVNLVLGGKSHPLYRYTPKNGEPDFFDKKGQSARKALLRTPIDGARLSSRFGSRHHPILGYTVMHRGVDFAAPTGTPIYAAGDGKIEARGRNGAYGNYIRIRHNGEYATAYAHMSRFAPRLNRGSRVRQGDVIGYVGTTGRSTGPHLHYEILKSGSQINPLSVKMPSGIKLAGAELKRYDAHRERLAGTFQRVVAPAPLVAENP